MGEDSTYKREFPVSWEELHRHARALAWRLAPLGPFEGIVCVTRGGLVPAAILARELNLRVIDTVCVSTYDFQESREANVLKVPTLARDDGKGWLLVDDLVDTGKTATKVRELLPNAHFATVYAKPQGRPLVDTFITEVSQDTWIFFPWDIVPQYSRPIAEIRD